MASKLIKSTCTRCGGSGHYSFHMVRGTVCFACNGTGYVMRDPKNDERNKAKKEAKKAAENARRELYSRVYNEVVADMNALYGPFNTDTALGIDQLNNATAKATGKALHVIRDERVKQLCENGQA